MVRHSARDNAQDNARISKPATDTDSNADDVVAKAIDLTKTYGDADNQVTALNRVNISFRRGQMTAIMGPSGSGKSTLMHCMAGLDQPTSGQVFVEGLEVSAMSQKQLTRLRRQQIGFIFQSFNLVPTLSAEENILLPLQIAKRPIDRAWFKQVVHVVGLEQRLSHRPSQLSGGQQQRVACARALMARPSVIFADEPTGNLDSRSSREVLSFLKQSVRDYGQSIVMVTHDPRAASYADRVVVLADGNIIEDLDHPSYERILDVFADNGDDDIVRSDVNTSETQDDTTPDNATGASRPGNDFSQEADA
ncbi:ABC transporter ATP-binding protein [Bifidobacterium olomucense]|uniref:ABC transporter ATP-binding protein n=1 Tax=Bifidobacterium olomucense TaxID=2675324 RepID=A0A7Y0EX51_9BIFI|nr:ABC transporter ATP-binding protein [Bifidobacterium sp. DSM 109959]NMM97678.1 ABC transporter ATP-binding protein [Bifidobacterium sp. DSM 109959]